MEFGSVISRKNAKFYLMALAVSVSLGTADRVLAGCVDWAVENMRDGDVIIVGQFVPVKGRLHAWLCNETNVCRDEAGEFWKSSADYKAWKWIDTTQPGVLAELINSNFRKIL